MTTEALKSGETYLFTFRGVLESKTLDGGCDVRIDGGTCGTTRFDKGEMSAATVVPAPRPLEVGDRVQMTNVTEPDTGTIKGLHDKFVWVVWDLEEPSTVLLNELERVSQ